MSHRRDVSGFGVHIPFFFCNVSELAHGSETGTGSGSASLQSIASSPALISDLDASVDGIVKSRVASIPLVHALRGPISMLAG
ncbi:MAG: hypothetical protein QNL39_08915 [Akkermansiaceae bacterium]